MRSHSQDMNRVRLGTAKSWRRRACHGPGWRPDDRLSVWSQPRPQHLLPSTPLASGTPSSRTHPSNERCLLRITRRHSGGSLRQTSPPATNADTTYGPLINIVRNPIPNINTHRLFAYTPVAITSASAAASLAISAAALAWRRAVEHTRSRQSFSTAPSGSFPCST